MRRALTSALHPLDLPIRPAVNLSGRLSQADRTANRLADHLLGAASPALVKSRIVDSDRQVIPASVMPCLGARRASSHVIPAHLPNPSYMVENPKFRPSGAHTPGRRVRTTRVALRF